MRILLLNANTTAAMTDRMAGIARELAPSVEWVPATARFGAAYIATRAAAAIAAHAALDAAAPLAGQVDRILLACFGDPGLDALREATGLPVTGMADASIRRAAANGGRVAVLTGGLAWEAMLAEFAAARGLPVATVRAVPMTGAEIAADPGAAIGPIAALARDAAAASGAGAVLLGGAGLVGLAPAVAAASGLPVLDSLTEAVAACLTEPAMPSAAPSPEAPMAGLSPVLAAMLRRT